MFANDASATTASMRGSTAADCSAMPAPIDSRVHHYDAVARQQQHACMFKNTHPIVRYSVVHQDPIAIWLCGGDFPAAQQHAIACPHIEAVAMHAHLFKRDVCFSNQLRRK